MADLLEARDRAQLAEQVRKLRVRNGELQDLLSAMTEECAAGKARIKELESAWDLEAKRAEVSIEQARELRAEIERLRTIIGGCLRRERYTSERDKHIAALTTAGNALDEELTALKEELDFQRPQPDQIEWRRVRDES